MTLTVIMVVVGGALGAPLRYLTDLAVQARHDTVIPWGTFAVNATGSFALGALVGAASVAAVAGWLLSFGGTGVCGALTTFSTFGYETVRLVEEGSLLAAFLNTAANLVAGLLACTAGWGLATVVA
jgi:CrcB protein